VGQMSKIRISFEVDGPLTAIEVLKVIQRYETNGLVSIQETEMQPSPLTEKEEVRTPPPPNKKDSVKTPPPPSKKDSVKTPPPPSKKVSKEFDVKKARDDINDELTRIMNNGGDARSYLNKINCSGIQQIPEGELISFLEMLRGE